MPFRYGDIKEFQELDNLLLIWLDFRFEESHDDLIYFLNCLVHNILAKMLEWGELWSFQFARRILFCHIFGHSVEVLPMVVLCLFHHFFGFLCIFSCVFFYLRLWDLLLLTILLITLILEHKPELNSLG